MTEVCIFYNYDSKKFFSRQEDNAKVNPMCRSTVNDLTIELNNLGVNLDGSVYRKVLAVIFGLGAIGCFCCVSLNPELFLELGLLCLVISGLQLLLSYLAIKDYETSIEITCLHYKIKLADYHDVCCLIGEQRVTNRQAHLVAILKPTDLTSKFLAQDSELLGQFISIAVNAKYPLIITPAESSAVAPMNDITGPLIGAQNDQASQQYAKNYPDLEMNAQNGTYNQRHA